MIWGKTHGEYMDAYHKALVPAPWFAWFPVEMEDGRKVWLETVLRLAVRGAQGTKVHSWKWVYREIEQ